VRWIAGKTDGKVAADLSDNVLRDAFRARKTGGSSAVRDAEKAAGCALCFPAGTLVTTAHGAQAIQTLHVGDVVQAGNPATGKVEAEAVQAVIQDPVSPLIAVDLSDGSAITVTADHPFWVDGGAQLAGAGWFAAGRLQAGDELRTVSGTHVMVVGLRRNVGEAVVYTLTIANDHTFFVGSARVLVHNLDSNACTQLAGLFRSLLIKRFVERGNPLILDENLDAGRGGESLASYLRARGLNVLSVREIFSGGGILDPEIRALAERINARIITQDIGRQTEGGFGNKALRIPARVSGGNYELIYRLIRQELGL